MKKILYFSLFVSLFAAGCGSKTKAPKAPDLKKAESVSVKIERLDKDMAALNVNELEKAIPPLKQKYGNFYELFCDGILGIGRTSDPHYLEGLHAFLTYPVVQDAFHTSAGVFTPQAISAIESDLSSAFSYYKGTFPDKVVPKVYSYVAGFNQSVVIADSSMGIGLDKYLGSGYAGYAKMGFPRYLIRKMSKEMIPVDAMYAWASGDFPIKDEQQPLLSHIIYQGKLMYLLKQVLPETPDTLIFGFTGPQYKWVQKNEKSMWEILVAKKLLFSTEVLVKTKMIGEAPFSNLYSTEAPGKAAVWQGYRIVCRYMRNSGSSLSDLMKEDSYQRILDEAKYRP